MSPSAIMIDLAVQHGLLAPETASASLTGSSGPVAALADLGRAGQLDAGQLDWLERAAALATTSPVIPGYRVVGRIGGLVWKAVQESMDRTVALKLQPLGSSEDQRRFQREARIATTIQHDNVAACFDSGKVGDLLFTACELVAGTDCERFAASKGGRLRERSAVKIVRDAAAGVRAIAAAGLVHRNLKPSNLLITGEGVAKITDLAMVRPLTVQHPGFLSPEQARGDNYLDTRSDLWALGALFHWLLTNQAPITGADAHVVRARVARGEASDPRLLLGALDERIRLIVRTALSADRTSRYQIAAELREDCIAVLKEARPPTHALRLRDQAPPVAVPAEPPTTRAVRAMPIERITAAIVTAATSPAPPPATRERPDLPADSALQPRVPLPPTAPPVARMPGIPPAPLLTSPEAVVPAALQVTPPPAAPAIPPLPPPAVPWSAVGESQSALSAILSSIAEVMPKDPAVALTAPAAPEAMTSSPAAQLVTPVTPVTPAPAPVAAIAAAIESPVASPPPAATVVEPPVEAARVPGDADVAAAVDLPPPAAIADPPVPFVTGSPGLGASTPNLAAELDTPLGTPAPVAAIAAAVESPVASPPPAATVLEPPVEAAPVPGDVDVAAAVEPPPAAIADPPVPFVTGSPGLGASTPSLAAELVTPLGTPALATAIPAAVESPVAPPPAAACSEPPVVAARVPGDADVAATVEPPPAASADPTTPTLASTTTTTTADDRGQQTGLLIVETTAGSSSESDRFNLATLSGSRTLSGMATMFGTGTPPTPTTTPELSSPAPTAIAPTEIAPAAMVPTTMAPPTVARAWLPEPVAAAPGDSAAPAVSAARQIPARPPAAPVPSAAPESTATADPASPPQTGRLIVETDPGSDPASALSATGTLSGTETMSGAGTRFDAGSLPSPATGTGTGTGTASGAIAMPSGRRRPSWWLVAAAAVVAGAAGLWLGAALLGGSGLPAAEAAAVTDARAGRDPRLWQDLLARFPEGGARAEAEAALVVHRRLADRLAPNFRPNLDAQLNAEAALRLQALHRARGELEAARAELGALPQGGTRTP